MRYAADNHRPWAGWRGWLATLATLGCLQLTVAAPCSAEDTYEWQRTQRLLEELDLALAGQPQGKRIAYVRVVRDNIFVEDELWPVWANWFHKLTRDEVVRRELLFAPGEPYRKPLIEETMRNLRSMGIFALVRIVAVQTDDPDEVGIVVHTRDVWSLRLEQEVSIDRTINLLRLLLIERNLAGRNEDLGAEFIVVPDKYFLAESYEARRLFGSSLRFYQYQGLMLGRFSPGLEGSTGGAELSQPFYRLAQRLSWDLGGRYDVRTVRQLDRDGGYDVHDFDDGTQARTTYDQRSSSAYANVGYRFGDEVKTTWTAGFSYSNRQTHPNDETQLPDDPAAEAEFAREVMPLNRRDVGPSVSYDMFLARYVTLQNLGTFGQSENIRVGPSAHLSVYTPVAALGSTADALVLRGVAEATATRGHGIFSLSVDATSRLQRQQLIDQRLLAQLRFATPAVLGVRFVSRLALDARYNDSQRTFVSLGSDRGLRGYQARSFSGRGASRILANFELRTLPLKVRSMHLGGVLFYDVGSVYQSTSEIELHHAVGVGLRFFFPQFNRYPFSFDVGFPVDPDFRLTPSLVTPTLTSAQSVPLTNLEADTFP